MFLTPRSNISEQEKAESMPVIIREGVMTEMMTTLTGTVILTALMVQLNASNATIGMVAAFPSLANIFQLASIWLVSATNNRRAVSVVCSIIARLPLILIGVLVLRYDQLSISPIVGFLFVYYLFASVAGPAWNAWMRDLISVEKLGSFFSRRTVYMQGMSIVLSLLISGLLNLVKTRDPGLELQVYGWLFIVAGTVGLAGTLFLARIPEPKGSFGESGLISTLASPMKDKNFKKLLLFQTVWTMAFNIANPFFAVYLLKTIELSVSNVIVFNLIAQFSNVLLIKTWGKLSDSYSNKSLLAFLIPIYMVSLILWCIVDKRNYWLLNQVLLVVIHILSGSTQAGITQTINNITLKLSPAHLSIVYLSIKNIATAIFGALAPLVGGTVADMLSNTRFELTARYERPARELTFYLFTVHEWTFLFLIAAVLAFVANQLLTIVREEGEVEKDVVVDFMRSNVLNNVKNHFLAGYVMELFRFGKSRQPPPK